MAFACVLKELRVEQRLTSAQAADRVCISTRRWRRYEKGAQVPYMGHLFQFGAPFGIDPVQFLERVLQYRDELLKRRVL